MNSIVENISASKVQRVLWSILLPVLMLSYVVMKSGNGFGSDDVAEVIFYATFLVIFALAIANIRNAAIRKGVFWTILAIFCAIIFWALSQHSSGGFDVGVPFVLFFAIPPVILFGVTYGITKFVYKHPGLLKILSALIFIGIVFNLISAFI